MTEHKTVTRFAPSPTGLLHCGGYRTAIYSFLYARNRGGKFILRIEDTDKQRNKQEYADNILEALDWLKLKYDELHYQSERVDRHEFYLKKLIDEGKAYVSKEEPTKEGARSEVIRFKNPNKKVSFVDKIRGHIEFDTTELKDFVIAKSMSEPIFHLAVVVDDFELGVTDVIRAEEHISNTPRQILIQEAIGAPTPQYAHLPLVLGTDRSKLSKRKGALPLTAYRDQGYLPEALLNYIALVGWNPGTEQEIFTEDELIQQFDLAKVHKGGAIFDEVKLKWVNKEHMRKVPDEVFKKEAETRLGRRISEKVLEVIRERISYYGEIDEMKESGELDYLFEAPKYDKNLLIPAPKMLKTRKNGGELTLNDIRKIFGMILELLSSIEDAVWTKEAIKDALWQYAEQEGRAAVLWPLRVALSGREKSADPFTIAEIIGKADTLKRIGDALS